MKLKVLLAIFMIALMLPISTLGDSVSYKNKDLGDATITIDGEIDDWSDVDSVEVTLKPARDTGSGSYKADVYAAHDASKLYMLIVVKGDVYQMYDIAGTCATSCAHAGAPALAVAWPIDTDANPAFMGATARDDLETSTGEVDIFHWELDTIYGATAGGSKNTTYNQGDGTGNADDEYATAPEDRFDDNDNSTSENSYTASWGWSAGDSAANGSDGDWYFEFSRDLQTGDIHDAQFAEGNTIETAIAFWTPNESAEKIWSDDGHYVNYDNTINMEFVDDEVGAEDAPGFGIYLAFASLFVLSAVIVRRRR